SQTGIYSVSLNATSGSIIHSITTTVKVQDFGLSSAGSIQVNVGSTGSATVNVTSLGGLPGIISSSNTTSSSRIHEALSPLSLTRLTLPPSPTTSVLTCKATAPADYIVTVNGTNGTLSHTTATILFHVVDFSITSNPSSQSLAVGQSSQSASISLTSLNSFTG